MLKLHRTFSQLRGRTCYTCRYSDIFRSNGDGQVSRLHTYCRWAGGPHANRPIPPEQWCEGWRRAEDPDKNKPEEIDQTGLTA